MKIRQAVPLLVERLRQQKVILFVGAGLSQASGLPGWKKLFAPFCKKLGCPEEENFPAVATTIIVERIHNRKEIIEHIVKQIGAVNLELNPNHELIKRLPFKILITTNYDNLLEDLYGPSRLTRIYSDEGMAYFDPHSAKRQLIYLHGDINHPEHMVVSSIDYQYFVEKRPIMVERLNTLLQDYTFLFTGYSANDPNLLAVLDHFRLTYKENANRHFIVMEDPGKVKQTQLYTRFGLEPVLLTDKKELTSFLQALVETYENSALAPAPGREEEAGEPGDRVSGDILVDRQSSIVMAADLKIIEQIEKQIGKKLKPLPLKNIMNLENNGYVLYHARQVRGLNLDGTKVKDISILGNLGGLTHLSLANNQITDLTPLQELTNVTFLNLENNQITDLTPLHTLTKLKNLRLGNNKIEDINPLAALTHLKELVLYWNHISDISPLSGLIELTSLSLSANNIIGLSPLIPLTSLKNLWLNNNVINNLTPLRALTQLVTLGLRINSITDLIPLKELPNLKGLNVSRNNIKKLPPDIVRWRWWSSMEITWVDDDTTDKGFYLYGNPLTNPPVEIVKQRKAAVENYFASLGDRQSSQEKNEFHIRLREEYNHEQ